MKINAQARRSMKSDLLTVVNHYGFISMFQAYTADKVNIAFKLWQKVHMNRAYSSDNPNVILVNKYAGRLLPYTPDFELYPCNTNDDTLKTALVKVLNDIFA